MRTSILLLLGLSAVGLLTPFDQVRAEEPLISTSTAEPSRISWEVGGAFFKSISSHSPEQLGAARILLRRLLNDTIAVGPDLRFWPAGSYPLSETSSSPAWAAGGQGQIYLFKNRRVGVYLAASLLWVPSASDLVLAPEAGFKWFASQRVALGIAYSILSDLGSYAASLEPQTFGKSLQSLGLEVSFYL